MRHRIRMASVAAGLIIFSVGAFRAAPPVVLAAPQSFDTLQSPETEQYLRDAKIVRLGKTLGGVTQSRQAILELNGVTHFAVFKTIDERRSGLTDFAGGGGEINFQDSWRTEIPAYELDKLLGLGMVPVTVARAFEGKEGSLQAWVELPMSEAERLKKKIPAPNAEAWNRQIHKVRAFDNLIYNTDRHANNIWISKDWRVILIDHSRTFRNFDVLRAENDLVRFSRSMLEAMDKLNKATLTEKMSKYLDAFQIEGVLKRRDLIVARARRLAKERGEAAVLFP
jgi:hypothetical protein